MIGGGTNRPSRRGGVAVETSTQKREARPLADDQRRIIAGFTQGDIGRSSIEHCVAVLLREGMDPRTLYEFENLTRGQLRDAVDSVLQRVHLRLDQPETPPNADAIRRGYLRAVVDGDEDDRTGKPNRAAHVRILPRLKLTRSERKAATLRYGDGLTVNHVAKVMKLHQGKVVELLLSVQRKIEQDRAGARLVDWDDLEADRTTDAA